MRSSSKVLILTTVAATTLVGCYVVRKKADETVGDAVVGLVADDPELAEKIEGEAVENIEAGVTWPWLRAIQSNWLAVLLTALLGGTGGQLWRTYKRAGVRGAIAEVLSRALSDSPGDAATSVKEAAEAHPNLPTGSVRELMRSSGLKPSR